MHSLVILKISENNNLVMNKSYIEIKAWNKSLYQVCENEKVWLSKHIFVYNIALKYQILIITSGLIGWT